MAAAKQKPGTRGKWLWWLHKIGYVTTALVAAELLAIGFFGIRGWLQQREMRAAQIEASRTHDGPLLPTDDNLVRGSAIYLLGKLPPLGALHGDGFRFVAMPSFNRSHFAVAIFMPQPAANEAHGVVSQFDGQNNYAPLGQRQFLMPASAYRSLVAKMDRLTDGWPGGSGFCLDGTPAAFERIRDRRVTSGIGNCETRDDQVTLLVWKYLRQFAPGDDLPTRGDWEPSGK